MSFIFRKKLPNKYNSSQLQLNMIKYNQDNKENEIYISDCNTQRSKTELYNSYLYTDLHKMYTIIKKIYEKQDKATYIVLDKETKAKYLLKIRHNSCVNLFESEIYKILKKNIHKNVISFINYTKFDNYQYYIYEYFEGYNLAELLNKKNKLQENEIKHIILQITNGLKFLHSYDIIHCDLKLDNIIINDNNDVKIIDFDLAIICSDDEGYISNNIFGTMQYIAPESHDLCIYSKNTDIWQLGIILYVLITNKFPFDDTIEIVNSNSNLCRQNIFKHIDYVMLKKIIHEKKYNPLFYDLLYKMLSFDDSKRATVYEIINCINIMEKKLI